MSAADLDAAIRRIPDHPHEGILFYDLMPLFEDAGALATTVDRLAEWARPRRPELVLGVEARGFIVGGALAVALGAGFAAARKEGRLPGDVEAVAYDLEYGSATIELHREAIAPGRRVLVHDDLLATGGTAEAACRLVESLGGVVVGVAFVVELTFLGGRERLAGRDVTALVGYASEAVTR